MLCFGELSVQMFSGVFVRFCGFLRRFEVPQYNFFLFKLNFCAPAIGRRFPHAFEPARVVNWGSAVAQVLGRSCFAQIFPSIVRFVLVLVVDFKFGPFACHPKPNQSMREIVSPINDNSNMTLHSGRTGDAAFGFSGRSAYVGEQSRFGIIIEDRSHVLSREIGVGIFVSSGHAGTLAQMPLLVNAP